MAMTASKSSGCALRVPRDVELFLHEPARLIANWFFRVADVDHTAGPRHFLDSGAKGLRKPDGFNNYIRSEPAGQLLQAFMERLASGMNGVCSSGLSGQIEFRVIYIDANHGCASKPRP